MLHSKMKEDRQGGFTLIELMFTITVLAILLGFGIPNFRDFIRNSRMSAEANDILSGINLTRSEAVKRRAPVTLCSGTAAACVNDGDFSDGWVVFVDTDADGLIDVGTEDVLREHPAMPDGFQTAVYETSDGEDEDEPDYDVSDLGYVSYGQTGFRRMNDGTLPVALGVVICDQRENALSGGGPDMSAARALELGVTGRASITRSKDRIDVLGGCP
jgi:prepilin-type N-terminal cleavage/methylation domain-containing protein